MSELSQLSCGHSCVIARPEGMATNGGCSCLAGIADNDQRRLVQRALVLYRRELGDARRVVGEGWFAGGVSLAQAIARKCAALEDTIARLDAARKGERT